MITLECMARLVGRARPKGAQERGRDADGEVCGRKEEAAARVRPKLVRRGVVEARAKARENSLVVWRGIGRVLVGSSGLYGLYNAVRPEICLEKKRSIG